MSVIPSPDHKYIYSIIITSPVVMDPWPIAMLALVFLATDALICLTWFAERHYERQEPARS